MSKPYFSPRLSNLLKGAALLMMLVHHFFGFPDWYVPGIDYPNILPIVPYLGAPLKLCVTVFAFLNGYLYYFQKRQMLRNSLRKAGKLLVSYWLVLIPAMAAAVLMGRYALSVKEVLLESVGLRTVNLPFAWYVWFYVLIMAVLPVFVRFLPGGGWDVLIGLILPTAVLCVLQALLRGDAAQEVLYCLVQFFPVVMAGYLTAKHAAFERVFDTVSGRMHTKPARALLWLCLVIGSMLGRRYVPQVLLGTVYFKTRTVPIVLTMDVVYGPCFVYGLIRLAKAASRFQIGEWVTSALAWVGGLSMWVWFLHGVFFGPLKEILQPVLYAPRFAPLVLVWGLGLCLGVAVVLEKISRCLFRKRA